MNKVRIDVIWSDDQIENRKAKIADVAEALVDGFKTTPKGRRCEFNLLERIAKAEEVVPKIRERWGSESGGALRLWVVDIVFANKQPAGLQHLTEVFRGSQPVFTDMVVVSSSHPQYEDRVREILGDVTEIVWHKFGAAVTFKELVEVVGQLIDKKFS